MADLGFSLARPGFRLIEALSQPAGFLPDVRFGAAPAAPSPELTNEPGPHMLAQEEPDPVADAYTQGFAAGFDQARAEAEARAAADAAAHQGLMLSFARFDAVLEEELRMRLRETVAALCSAALAPLAIDEEALMHRIQRAVSMLARADDERVIHLHPDDLKLVSPRLSAEWEVVTDAQLERGTIRVDGASGGVEDGPATWRLAIAEAFHHL